MTKIHLGCLSEKKLIVILLTGGEAPDVKGFDNVFNQLLDIPVLGRDVMNFFALLCDFKANLILLIDEADRTKLLQFCDAIETP